ncbi:MAG: ribonuclease III [Clostridia bacterium]|nr:ribonuclease III [Clostridia bacterium]
MVSYPLPIELLEKEIGYKFNDITIIKTALTHSSYANEQKTGAHKKKIECNERLEFLGDSVLSFITSRYIFEKFADNPEGYLTKIRAAVVCSKSLASLANKIGLGKYILLGKGEEENGRINPKILENTFEALLAAIYLDSNHSVDTVSEFLMPLISEEISEASKNQVSLDYKTSLQQFVQATGKDRLQYICVGESGPDHNKTFEVEAKLNSNVIGRGIGKTKREAEQKAAKEALELFAIR